jgi:hypothetical protein
MADTKQQRAYLESQIATAQQLLDETPTGCGGELARLNLAYHVQDLRRKLAKLEDEART